MYNIVFVHGTGVREPHFGTSFSAIKNGLGKVLPNAQLHACYWGGDQGSRLGRGLSIPQYQQSKSTGEIGLEDDPIMQWSLLLDDPLIELKLIAAQGNAKNSSAPPGQNPSHLIRNALTVLRTKMPVELLPDDASKLAFDASSNAVLNWNGLDAAIQSTRTIAPSGAQLLDAVRLLISRAIVAGWLAQMVDAGQIPPSAKIRDDLVDACFIQLGGGQVQTKGVGVNLLKTVLSPIGTLLRAVIVDPSKRALVWGSKLYRHSWTDMVSPAVGDILLYQARGKAIRDFILKTADDIKQPVILIAHSLGGVASIDLLIEQARPAIKGIITVGSQAPFFYEINALSQLAFGESLPDYMPPWLNVYDPADLLAFVGAKVLKGGKGVEDLEVASGQPFPLAHGAYWNNDVMWQQIAPFIREHLQ